LQQAEKIDTVYKRMQEHERDRNSKGHFDLPSAGSVFKNNRSFGQPTGKLIDNLGLRGYTIGGAKISEAHANIIVNTGTATAREILALIRYVEKQVKQEYGFELERELLLVGEW
jgi:UDP-N-acetylmuramate dehydrogenase